LIKSLQREISEVNGMVQSKPRFSTFDAYLSYDDGTDRLYELFNGELIEVPPESGRNTTIAGFLFLYFSGLIDFRRVRGHGLELEVRGEPRNRYPDLTIIREEHVQQLERRNTIRLSMAPPLLVIEVVSPGDIQRDRDYIAKRQQYEDLGIPEYWIVDPQTRTVTVLELRSEEYGEVGVFTNSDQILSPTFPELDLTVDRVFAAGS
jgi:Uma2 family endonuclease